MPNYKPFFRSLIFVLTCVLLSKADNSYLHGIENSSYNQKPLNQFNITKAPCVREKKCEFRVTPLETIKYNWSEATGINDKGEIVGVFTDHTTGKQSAFFCLLNGEVKILDIPFTNISGLKINNASQIIGNATIDGYQGGFFIDENYKLTIIEGLGGAYTKVNDINDYGQVVGCSDTGKRSEFAEKSTRHAFVWENGEINDLGTLHAEIGLAGDLSEAIAINNHGEIVGMSNFSIDLGTIKKKASTKPFYWNGMMHEIPYGIQAVTINNKSNVALNGNNESLIWNPRHSITYSISHTTIADLNDNNMLLFKHSSLNQPNKKFLDEIVFYKEGKLHREITCINTPAPLSFIHYLVFNKLNNNNIAVGKGTIESLNETHAFILKNI